MGRNAINVKGLPSVGPYSHAAEAGGLVFLSGLIPLDPDSGTLITGDIEAATALVFANAERVLAGCGLSFDDVVKVAVYLTDMRNFGPMNAVYAKQFDSDPPARTCVGVAELPKGVPIEIEITAAR